MKSKFLKKKNESILLFGHRGLIGSAILDQLKLRGYNKVLIVNRDYPVRINRYIYARVPIYYTSTLVDDCVNNLVPYPYH